VTTIITPISLGGQQHIVLEAASWALYEQLLRDLDSQPMRVTFDEGNLEMMAPLPLHEKWKSRIGRLVEILAEELDIEIETLGSTTFRREDLGKGLEPDECYYVQNVGLIQGKDNLDLAVDPPPDLAVEVEISRRSVPREPIYAALGVPELWRFDGRQLTILRLDEGAYHETDRSIAFPFLPSSGFESFLLRFEREKQTRLIRDFRAWVRSLAHN
jgi:Uma2 family endonuclease